MPRNKIIKFRATEAEHETFKNRKMLRLVRALLALTFKEYEKVERFVNGLKGGE